MAILYRTSTDYILGLEKRTSLYLDDFTESQQKTVLDMIELLRREFQNKNR